MAVCVRVAMWLSVGLMVLDSRAAAGQSIVGGALDGQVFVGHLVIERTGATLPERLVFEAGELHSDVCSSFGIASGPYSSRIRDRVVRFRSYGETIELWPVIWVGTIEGNDLKATVRIRQEDASEAVYAVTATRALTPIHKTLDTGADTAVDIARR